MYSSCKPDNLSYRTFYFLIPQGRVMQGTFVSTMQQGQRQHLSLVFWNGAGCVKKDFTVLVEPHMK